MFYPNLCVIYELDVDLNMIFGKRGESVTQVKTKLDFRVTVSHETNFLIIFERWFKILVY